MLKFTKCDVFTPEIISRLMASKLSNAGTLLEPSAGTGNLLRYVEMGNYTQIDAYELKAEYLAEIKNERVSKHNADFLHADIQAKYDNIIMNPPYIKVQDLTMEYRAFLNTKFRILNGGMVDIYYAFILKCLDVLSDNGTMVCITPNSYLYNKSAFGLRKHLIGNGFIKEIIDYKTEKVFAGISAYCCITVMTKQRNEHLVYNGTPIRVVDIGTSDYNIFNRRVETASVCCRLRDVCRITNGIATLRDGIYIHAQKKNDEPCWQPITNGREGEDKYIIYPYINGKIMDETAFQTANPKTYAYLTEHKHELSLRDKSNKTYPQWFAYGRTQSLVKSTKENVIYIPAFINPNEFQMSVRRPALFQSCLCIEPFDGFGAEQIVQSIKENIKHLEEVSSKRSGGWITVSSRNLYDISITVPTALATLE